MMINLHCPDFYTGINIYNKLIELYRTGPEAFREDVNLTHIFGSFPGMTWNGGSVILGSIHDYSIAIDMEKFYRMNNIPLKITLTNPMLEERDLMDRYCNTILQIMENDINEVLVSTDIVEEYVREHYPKYKVDKSIIKNTIDLRDGQLTPDVYIQYLASNKYETVVLPRTKAKDLDFLKEIPMELRGKVEILLNDVCPLYCPKIGTHYEQIGLAQLGDLSMMKPTYECLSDKMYPGVNNKGAVISYDDIKEIYEPLGYSEFKVSGRWHKPSIALNITKYLIKPEYQFDVLQYLLNNAYSQEENSKI